MSDGTFSQSQRDVAFSNIFGNAPPPGRSGRTTSMVVRPMTSMGNINADAYGHIPQPRANSMTSSSNQRFRNESLRPTTSHGFYGPGGGHQPPLHLQTSQPGAGVRGAFAAQPGSHYGMQTPAGTPYGYSSSGIGGGLGAPSSAVNGGSDVMMGSPNSYSSPSTPNAYSSPITPINPTYNSGYGGRPYSPAPGTAPGATTTTAGPTLGLQKGYDRSTTLSGRIIPQKQEFPRARPHNKNEQDSENNNGSNSSYNNGNNLNNNNALNGGNNYGSNSNVSYSSTSVSSVSTLATCTPTSHIPGHHGLGGNQMVSPSLSAKSKKSAASVYAAMLSRVAMAFKERIVIGDRVKNELTYKNAFTGAEAVTLITYIIKTPDRNLALLLGRALDAQRFFHDVTYEHRLRDSEQEVYQFNEPTSIEDDIMLVREIPESLGRQGSATSDRVSHSSSVTSNTAATVVDNASDSTNVNGVFILLAECYSPTCTRDQLCYSIACPRRLEQQARLNMKPQPGLKRSDSRASLHEDKPQKLWIHSVPKEVADSVDDKERKRQEVICEVIYTERDFVKDMEYLRDFWIKPLRASTVLPDHRREEFIRRVFGPAMEVHSVNIRLAEALTKRQQQAAVVKQIGDIFLEHVPHFAPFIRYGANQLYAKYEFEREKSTNAQFARFVDETERLKESRKLELNGYLTKPTTRLARYPLLLEAVLKYTKEENPDRENIPKAISLIRGFLTKVNIESGKTENRFSLLQLAQSLVFRPGEYVDLKLTDERRQIIFKGTLKKKTDQGDVHVYLLDNVILFVKVKIVNKREQLRVNRKPIPLELLMLAEGEEILPKSMMKRPSSSLIPMGAAKDKDKDKFPITFQHLGRRGYELTLFSPTYIGRKKWIENIENQRTSLRDKGNVYKSRVLQKRYFGPNMRVTCMVPCDGGRKLLFGTDVGVFVCSKIATGNGKEKEVFGEPRKIIAISSVSQIDVLEEYTTILALCDKTLYSWPLDCLETDDPLGNYKRAKKVASHVNFYNIGLCLGRLLVCTVKSSSMTSTIKVWEPFDPQPRSKRQTAPLRRLLQQQSEGLKIFKEFYIPSETLSISFLKRKLCVGCAKGFEIVDLATLETQSLLDPADTSLDFAIRKEALKPSSIYRLKADFLLNYSDFSFFVNGNGWRTKPDWIIHWEGLPQHFALSYPYLVAFEPNFIEVRHMESGEIARVIVGDNIRFLHESTRELLYVHEDEQGYDEIVSLDFWESVE